MHDPDQVEFHETIERPTISRTAVRGGMILGAALLFAIGVASVMGASASPSTGADPSTGTDPSTAPSAAPSSPTTPNTQTAPNGVPNGGPGTMHGFGFGFPGHGFGIGGDITITAIDGSNLSLKTEDGWTRTIAVTSATTITRAGTTIAVGDLKVGDQIVFRQQRQDDGTYKITDVGVVLPTVAGAITKIDGSTITVKRFDGTTQVVHVDSSTTYRIAGQSSATLGDLKVGDAIIAQGTQRTDGSLDAASVAGGTFPGPGGDGKGRFDVPGFPGWPGGDGPDDATPGASPAPSTSAG